MLGKTPYEKYVKIQQPLSRNIEGFFINPCYHTPINKVKKRFIKVLTS